MKKVHKICLVGALGNQMFGYAFYKYTKYHLHRQAQLSYVFWFPNKMALDNNNQKFHFLSDVFHTEAAYADRYLFSWIGQMYRKIYYAGNKILFDNLYKEKQTYVYDEHLDFTKRYFVGYFQSYRYADAVKQELLKDFQLKPALSRCAQTMQDQIHNTPNSVAIHIRRGDYVQGYDGHFNVLDADYYTTAWAKIIQKYPNARPYIFSQDTDWCRQHLRFLPDPIFVKPNNDLQYEDMVLMSECTHNIIANSSYSWWAGYLNQHPDKIVVAPNHWTKDLQGTYALKDLIPPSWICV